MHVARGLLLAAVMAAGCASHSNVAGPGARSADPAAVGSVPSAHPGIAAAGAARRCLALAMYWEARGEGRDGMAAVGAVVLNRVADSRFPDTPCAVVHQGGETPPCQFSWWCDGRSDRPTRPRLWSQSLTLADELLARRPPDPTGGALFFHSTAIARPWQRTRTARIGHHVFYR